MNQWMTSIQNVKEGYHIVRTIVEEVEAEATSILTETEETYKTLCVIFDFC